MTSEVFELLLDVKKKKNHCYYYEPRKTTIDAYYTAISVVF